MKTFSKLGPLTIPLSASLVAFGCLLPNIAQAACTSGLACEQCDVSGYSPDTMAMPTGPNPGNCPDGDLDAFVAACLASSATSSTCTAWQNSENSSNASCLDCIFTQQTASTWGALVCTSTGCSVNTPGCVDVAMNQVSQEKQAGGSGSCGDLLNASYGCQDYACGTCSTTDFSTCTNAAIANECKSYDTPVESTTGACSTALADGSVAASDCFAGDDFRSLAGLMCGGSQSQPPDGGTQTDSGTTNNDSGTAKKDSGTASDAGNGGDAGTFNGKGKGCACDTVGDATGNSLALSTFALGVAAIFVRRRRK